MSSPSSPTVGQAEALRLRRVRARLKRATDALDDFECRLQALHADRTGAFRLVYAPPLVPAEFLHVERAIARNCTEAKRGCPLAAEWMKETAEQRERIEALRNKPLPEKDPSYTGPMGWPHRALTAGKRRRVNPTFRKPSPEENAAAAAAHMQRVAERKARGLSLLDEFLAGGDSEGP